MPRFRASTRAHPTQQDRRRFLHAASIGCLGFGLAGGLTPPQSTLAAAGVRAKPANACIFLFMWGGPNRLKNDLIPPADMALSALLEDLQQRGMLEETLVVWVGEFGRKPQITAANAGREHWPFCYSGLMAGGGIRGGMVYGESDAIAAYPISNPVSPQDFGTTIVHALGIPIDTTLPDREGRPHPTTSGRVIESLFA